MPTITALFNVLKSGDDRDADAASAQLRARASEAWPILRREVSVDEDNFLDDNTYQPRLRRLLIAQPAPLDEALLCAAALQHFSREMFFFPLVRERPRDAADAALRFVSEPDASVGAVGADIFSFLAVRTGVSQEWNDASPTPLPERMKQPLLDALRRGVEPYALGQILVRHGWAIEEALPALCAAIERAMIASSETDEDGEEHVGYDLACDLQEVVASLRHAPIAMRQHLDLVARIYAVPDVHLRSTMVECMPAIGGPEALALVRAWKRDFEASDYLSKYGIIRDGFRVSLDLSAALLEGQPGGEALRRALPERPDSTYVRTAIRMSLHALCESDAEGVDAVLSEHARGDGPWAADAHSYLLKLRAQFDRSGPTRDT